MRDLLRCTKYSQLADVSALSDISFRCCPQLQLQKFKLPEADCNVYKESSPNQRRKSLAGDKEAAECRKKPLQGTWNECGRKQQQQERESEGDGRGNRVQFKIEFEI